MSPKTILPREALYRRIEKLVSVAMKLPENLSDEEVEGLLKVLPPDTRRSVTAILNPRHREVGIAFMKLIGNWLKEARFAREQGKKVILLPFNFPPEIIHIFKKAVPLTSEILTTLGASMLEGQGERYWNFAMGLGIPDYVCSSSTIELGSILSGNDFEPDALIQGTVGACDVNAKIHEFVSLYMNIPQFIIEKPTDNSARGREQHRRAFYRFIEQLESYIGEQLDENHMRDVLEKTNRATDLYYDLHELHKHSPCPVPNICALFTYGVRFTSWGNQGGVDMMQLMVDLAQERYEKGLYPAAEEIARCLWLYIGYYYDFLNFFNWMEEQGITYLHDVLSLCLPLYIDTTSKETMLNGLAEVIFEYPMTRQMGAPSMSVLWIDDMCRFIKELKANCAVYSGHHACKQTQSIISMVQREITGRTGAPVLCLQGDSWLKSITPISVIQKEIEQFVKQLVVKKGSQRRSKTSIRRQGQLVK